MQKWFNIRRKSTLAGMCVGFITAIVGRETLHEWLYELVPASALAFIAVVKVSWLYHDHGNTGMQQDQNG